MKKILSVFLLVFLVTGFTSCSIFHWKKEPDISRLEHRLKETNRKIDKLFERMSVLLSMVNRHEQLIRVLEKDLGKKPVYTKRKPITGPESGKQAVRKGFATEKENKVAGIVGENPEALYRKSIRAYNRRDYNLAVSLFNRFVIKYPGHYRANYAISWIEFIKKNKLNKLHGTAVSSASVTEKKKADSPIRVDRDMENLYKEAFRAYKKDDFKRAVSLFQTFMKKYPGHYLADNAGYWIGESLYSQKQFYDSILAFREVIEKYPNGNKASDAMLKIGFAYLALDDMENARSTFAGVIENYPGSSASRKARKKLADLDRQNEIDPQKVPNANDLHAYAKKN